MDLWRLNKPELLIRLEDVATKSQRSEQKKLKDDLFCLSMNFIFSLHLTKATKSQLNTFYLFSLADQHQ